MPVRVFDTQIAAGMVGIGSTIALDKLVEHIVGETLEKAETLSDWRVRPLSLYALIIHTEPHSIAPRPQLEYALRDVQHLHAMHDYLQAEITRFDRQAWFDEDMETARLVSSQCE